MERDTGGSVVFAQDAGLAVHHSLYVYAVCVHIPVSVCIQLCAPVCAGQRLSPSVFLDCF